MRLLLTHGFFLAEDPKEQQVLRPYPPLGILYLSAYLRSRGFDVDVYDSTFGSREELFGILDAGPPAMLGVYGNLLTRPTVLAIMERARASGWRVVLGGPEPSNYADEYLAAGAEMIVPGEGELVMEQVLRGELLSPCGAIRRDDAGRTIRTGSAPQVADLDSLPWPDRERIDINKYLRSWRERHGVGSVSLITARGCPYHCRWCSHSTFGKTHRRRSVAGVADEAEWVLNRYQPEMLWYADDVFTIHPGWTLRYAGEMKRRGIRIPFECITRADRLNEKTADALAEMGCFRVWIGSESGSQAVLDGMERGVRIEQVHDAVALAKARGIQAGMFLMWGYEGETLDDIEATVSHVERCRPDTVLTTVSYPIKGTPYYEQVADKLVRIGDWSSGTDRDVRIRGRHSRRYFQFADELLRASDDARRGGGSAGAQRKFRGGRGVTTPFDELAPLYAELWSESPEGRRQRDEFWCEIDGLFAAGSRVLDLGCGPGDDALHLMERGVDVLGIDNSEAMVAVARERGVTASWTAIEDLGAVEGEFDGAISNFGALNCVEDLGEAARELGGLIRPGGAFAVCVMGRFSWKETLRYLIRLDLRRAVRRWTGRAEWRGMRVFYRSSGATRRAFAPYFRLEKRVAIGGGDHDFYLFRRA